MKESNVKWWQVNNIVPLITSAVLIALSFAALITRISVLETKMDMNLSIANQTLTNLKSVEAKSSDLGLEVKELQTKLEDHIAGR